MVEGRGEVTGHSRTEGGGCKNAGRQDVRMAVKESAFGPSSHVQSALVLREHGLSGRYSRECPQRVACLHACMHAYLGAGALRTMAKFCPEDHDVVLSAEARKESELSVCTHALVASVLSAESYRSTA
eukprot:3785165-Pleurochrysis_carterae.AAC.1